MKALVFSPAAEADIDAIYDYSAKYWGVERAERYIDALRDTCIALGAGDFPGRPVDVSPAYRKQAAGSHVIFFRDDGTRIVVVRVLHGKQDVERHLRG